MPCEQLFLISHMDTLVSSDFFTKLVLTWRGWADAYVLVFIHLGSRRVFMSPTTFNPSDEWVLQQAINAAMWLEDIGVQTTLLIRDRDKKFSHRFDAFWRSEGVEPKKTPVRAPMANGYAEASIAIVKKQCLNHFFFLAWIILIISTMNGWRITTTNGRIKEWI